MAYSIPVEFYELLEEKVGREVASKYDIELLRRELESKIEKLESKLGNRMDEIEMEIQIVRKENRFMFILLAVIVLAVNQNALEFIAKIFGIIK